MGISRITALVIDTNEVICTSAGPNENGKYSGWITHGPDKYRRPILNTESVWDSPEQAKEHMEKIVEDVRVFVENEE